MQLLLNINREENAMDLEKINGVLHEHGMTYAQFQQLETLGKACFVGDRLVIKGGVKSDTVFKFI